MEKMLGIEYYIVEFRNTEGDDRWSVVRAPSDMEEYDIERQMMDDADVSEVYSICTTYEQDYGRDFCD